MFEGVLQPMHLIIVLAIVLALFGPAKLGQLGGSVGQSVRDFRRAMHDDRGAAATAPPAPVAPASVAVVTPPSAPPATRARLDYRPDGPVTTG